MTDFDRDTTDACRFWDYILTVVYGTTELTMLKDLPPDPHGHAFFRAVCLAFTPTEKMVGAVPVDQELVQYMASWCLNTSQGYDQVGGPIGTGRMRNHFVARAFSGFIQTLRNAIKLGQLRILDDGRSMHGCFPVPQWMIDKYMDELQDDADHINRLWDKNPGYRDYYRRVHMRS